MKRWIPDTIFGRLFLLLLAAQVLSHVVITFVLFSNFFATSFLHTSPPPRDPPSNLWFIVSLQFIAFTLAAWVGAKVLARPIQHLSEAASRLGVNLNHPPLVETGCVEARQATRVFNQMQERLRAQIEMRERFLAAISHDLRTPLTRMKLRIERLTDDPEKEKFRTDIAEVTTMLDATLEYLRSATLTEEWQTLDVQALMEAIADDARENGRNVSVSGKVRPLLTQPMALRRCISNVIENALRYGQLARISLTDIADRLIIEIQDAGPGIPQEKMQKVFEPFVRLETSRNKAYGGVGLGLSIVRDAARQCCGVLSMDNAPEGGLIVRLELPRRH